MTEEPRPESAPNELEELKRLSTGLQQSIAEIKEEVMERLVLSELKAEALRAGIIDLDGLRLLDPGARRLGGGNRSNEAAELIEGLKTSKPWLFQPTSSSAAVAAPRVLTASPKLATEMTDAEYKVARTRILAARAH